MVLGAQPFSNSYFGHGTGSIVLNHVNCAGNELRLFNCPRSSLGVYDCLHSDDAGVRCLNKTLCRLSISGLKHLASLSFFSMCNR